MTKRRPSPKRDPNNLADLRVALYCRVSLDKGGDEKSVDDQEAEGLRWIDQHQATLVDTYRDPNRSASRFATKQRENFNRLLADIEAGKLDGGAVWFWEASRSQRRLDVFATLRDLCRDHDVLWVIRDRVQDPSNTDDMAMAGVQAIFSESESEKTAQRVRRGKESSAQAGRPASSSPYGYRRIYDQVSRQLLQQQPDEWDGNGRALEDSPAWIVREIFERYAAGDGTIAITRDLNRRGIPASGGGRWAVTSVLMIAKNPAYISRRVHQGEVLKDVKGTWPPLVDEETFWAVQRVLSDPARRTWRPARARHLLSFVVRCDECGGPIVAKGSGVRAGTGVYDYTCREGHVGTLKAALDDYVQKRIVAWLSDPDVVADLEQRGDSAASRQARTDADQARVELEEWRSLAERGEISAPSFARAEKGLLKRIDEAERLAQAATLPPVLVGNVGPQAKAGWAQLDLAVKRQIITAVADIRLRPLGPGRYRAGVGSGRGRKGARVPVRDRVEWRWLLGPGSENGGAPTDPE